MTRRITLPRYRALNNHWRRNPRPEWLIAGYLGYKPAPEITPLRGAKRVAAPPTGALGALFESLGGRPGKTVVMAT